MPLQPDSATTPSVKFGAEEATHRRLAVVLWRRKWILIGTFLTLTILTAIVSRSLPKEYETTATLWVTESSGSATFDSVQAGGVLAGTYAKVADSQLIADQVAEKLPFDANGEEILGAMTFQPVPETQLLKITATDGSAVRARVIANTYARTFIDYSRSQLGDAVNADITFAAPASVPSQPARPQPTLYTIAGALLALVLGVGLALLAEMLDRRVRSSDELEAVVGAPVLARVPKLSKDPESQASFDEAFRLLRTNLQFLDREDAALRSLVVVSPSPGEGKSTVAFNLARSFAESDVRVILIEADMRRPSLARTVAGQMVEPGRYHAGLSDYLSHKVDLSAVLSETDLTSLRFIPSGILPPTPSSLFSAERTQILIADALKDADLVIVDTPPLSIGAEASTLAASVDGTLMVVDLATSQKPSIRRERQQLSVVGANLLGVALNGVRKLPSMEPYGYGFAPTSNGSSARRQRDAKRRVRADV